MAVHLERVGRIGVVSIDRPAKRNAIDIATAIELSDRLDALEADDEIWCGVLTGGQDIFSAGTDLHERSSPRTDAGGEYGIIRRARSKPLVAAVEGAALGGGFEIVLACDLVVAAENSRFGLPEVTIGVVATCGGLFRGPRALPLNVAREMALCGTPLDPERLQRLGVVNRLVPEGTALSQAIALAEQICGNSPTATSATLTAINRYAASDDDIAWHLTGEAAAAIVSSPDRAEGRAAFFERRRPSWSVPGRAGAGGTEGLLNSDDRPSSPTSGQRRGRKLAMSDSELDSFLSEERICRLANVSADGRVHNTPLWYVWHGGALWVSSIVRSRRWSDLRERPSVSVVVDAGTDYAELRGVELIGDIEIVGDVPRTGIDDPELRAVETAYADRFADGQLEHDGQHAWVRLRPTTIVSWDFRKFPSG